MIPRLSRTGVIASTTHRCTMAPLAHGADAVNMAGRLLSDSLRKTVVEEEGKVSSDTRFMFGTEYGSNYNKPPEKAYEVWKPLPLDATQAQTHGTATHLKSRSGLFPRLQSDPEEVKNKLVPALNNLMDACKAADPHGTGYVPVSDLPSIIKETGVFLSKSDMDRLLVMAPITPDGQQINYTQLVDVLLGKTTLAASGSSRAFMSSTGRPPLPDHVSWPLATPFTMTLRLRDGSPEYVLEAALMDELVKEANRLCKKEVDPEKVHSLLRQFLLDRLIVDAGTMGRPDVRFRQWLADNGVLSLTTRKQPGPIPPEVYDAFDQVIYEGLGIPKVASAVQTTTTLGSSMKRHQLQ